MSRRTFKLSAALFVLLIFLIKNISLPVNKTSLPPAKTPVPSPSVLGNTVIGSRSKTSGCQVNGPLPDTACTPGAVFPEVTAKEICVSGYSSSVRNVPANIKNSVYEEYGITSHSPGEYEVDHLISLELGGSNDIANLWPEAASPTPGFHQKDQLENYLHDQVCQNKLTLSDAQKIISANWFDYYREYLNP